jgi:hypothetical protein
MTVIIELLQKRERCLWLAYNVRQLYAVGELMLCLPRLAAGDYNLKLMFCDEV